MNDDRIEGEGRDIGGKVKETVGNLTGDTQLQSAGLADQFDGKTQKLVGQVKDFAQKRPFAFAALAGVIGVALINTLRGKR